MADTDPTDRLERHALVMAIWGPLLLVAAALLRNGLTGGNAWWIAAGFGAIVLAFAGHVIANAALGTRFTAGETALGGVAYAGAVVALLLTALIAPEEVARRVLLPVGIGLGGLVVLVIVYLVIAFGPRDAFRRFDAARENNPRRASALPHRGGRR